MGESGGGKAGGAKALGQESGDTTPCRMTGVTLHSHVRYAENRGPQHVRACRRPSGALLPEGVSLTQRGERGGSGAGEKRRRGGGLAEGLRSGARVETHGLYLLIADVTV